jgi:ankyrin repeat protein
LLSAIFNDQAQIVESLLRAGADPNVRNDEGYSPLRTCVEKGDLLTASLLLQAGATKTVDDYGNLHGLTALGMAATKLDLPMLQLLLGAGADPLACDEDNKTARERLPGFNPMNDSARRKAEALLCEHEGMKGGRRL